jgi:hypothetical protein
MTVRFRGHFDGQVIVPHEPIDLPVGELLEFTCDVPFPAPDNAAGGAADERSARSDAASRTGIRRPEKP